VVRRTTPFRSLDAYVANLRTFDEGFQRLSSGHYGQAVELFKRVLAENPGHVQSYGNMGLAYSGLGQKSLALACFDRALELDGNYEPALLNRRSIAGMREGEPFVPSVFLETEYYTDKLHGESKRGRAG
jgi:tetratricopeptide (TPR) repeat protein